MRLLLLLLATASATSEDSPSAAQLAACEVSATPLSCYFNAVETGPGVWKWRQYFSAYEKHFARFRGTRIRGSHQSARPSVPSPH